MGVGLGRFIRGRRRVMLLSRGKARCNLCQTRHLNTMNDEKSYSHFAILQAASRNTKGSCNVYQLYKKILYH